MKTQRHIPSLCVEETKAGSILTAMSINSTSLAKADPWGGYIFGSKFSASDTPITGWTSLSRKVLKINWGRGWWSLLSQVIRLTLIGLLRDLPSVKEHWRALDLTLGCLLTPVVFLRSRQIQAIAQRSEVIACQSRGRISQRFPNTDSGIKSLDETLISKRNWQNCRKDCAKCHILL